MRLILVSRDYSWTVVYTCVHVWWPTKTPTATTHRGIVAGKGKPPFKLLQRTHNRLLSASNLLCCWSDRHARTHINSTILLDTGMHTGWSMGKFRGWTLLWGHNGVVKREMLSSTELRFCAWIPMRTALWMLNKDKSKYLDCIECWVFLLCAWKKFQALLEVLFNNL